MLPYLESHILATYTHLPSCNGPIQSSFSASYCLESQLLEHELQVPVHLPGPVHDVRAGYRDGQVAFLEKVGLFYRVLLRVVEGLTVGFYDEFQLLEEEVHLVDADELVHLEVRVYEVQDLCEPGLNRGLPGLLFEVVLVVHDLFFPFISFPRHYLQVIGAAVADSVSSYPAQVSHQ